MNPSAEYNQSEKRVSQASELNDIATLDSDRPSVAAARHIAAETRQHRQPNYQHIKVGRVRHVRMSVYGRPLFAK